MGRNHPVTPEGDVHAYDGYNQRHVEKYNEWQKFKSQQRNTEHHLLQEKVLLQHELIEANDKLHQKRQMQDEQRRLQLRDAMKQEKAMKQQNLMNTSLQSLEKERKRHLPEQAKPGKKATEKLQDKTCQQKHNTRLPTIQSRERTRTESDYEDEIMEVENSTIVEEDEDEDFEDKEFHEYQLQMMFGKREANYFLRPRIEPEKKKEIHIPSAVRRKGGRAGATTLWKILREKTNKKLQKADSQIPEELKDAYGAFVRECLTKNKMVAKRSFYSGNEVPETEKLQDGSYRKKVHELRHNVELMYRSAHNNKDKTAILTFNNPLPDFSDCNGEEGPMRYYPSWIEEQEEVVPEPAYKKWLYKVDAQAEPPAHGVQEENHNTGLSKKTTLSFLTEADAKCNGQFWASKPKNPVENDNEDEIVLLSKRRSTLRNKSSTEKTHKTRSLTAPSTRTGGRTLKEPWQPLSLAALTEYKPTVDAPLAGPGNFCHGSANLWRPVLASESL